MNMTMSSRVLKDGEFIGQPSEYQFLMKASIPCS